MKHASEKIIVLGSLLAALTMLPAAAGATLLLNGDFEDTSSTVLPDGRLRFTGWTQKVTNGGFSGIFAEGANGLSAFDITATRFDGATSGAPDPLFPYQSEADPRLDHFAYTRPSGPAPLDSFAELFSDLFTITSSTITMDVWRESAGAFSEVRFHRAADDALLGSFSVTSPAQQWSRVSFDTSTLINTDAYIVLKGGTTQAGLGWLTLFDNITGGTSSPGSIPGAAGGPVPEPATLALVLAALSLLVRRRPSGTRVSRPA